MRVAVLLAALFAAASAYGEEAKPPAERPPNVVLVMVDDLGWNGLGCTGSSFHETPRMDRLCREGTRFANAYASGPNCSPTRAALLTGQAPARTGITNQIGKKPVVDRPLVEATSKRELAPGEVTLAEALRRAGYSTALVGKWNLALNPGTTQKAGFDEQIGATEAGTAGSNVYPFGNGPPLQVPLSGKEGDQLTDRLTDEAVAFMRTNRSKPFFLYLAYYAVHTPLQARADLVAKYEAKLRANRGNGNAKYAALLETVDQNVGRLLDAIDELALAPETIVILTSDNGADATIASPAPLRGTKGTLYEGGLRVPLVIRFPGRIVAGATSDAPVITVDLYPTLMELTGSQGQSPLDGVSLAPLLTRKTTQLVRDALYWHFPHYLPGRQEPAGAIREGSWKLIESFDGGRLELYDLASDPGEQRNLAEAAPEKAGELRDKLAAWRSSVGAAMPRPNPSASKAAAPR